MCTHGDEYVVVGERRVVYVAWQDGAFSFLNRILLVNSNYISLLYYGLDYTT